MRFFTAIFLFFLIPAVAFAGNPSTLETGRAYCKGNEIADVKYAVVDLTTSGDHTIVAAVTGKKIRVLSYVLTALADVSVRWESDAGGTALSGAMYIGPGETNQVLAPSCGGFACFETEAGELLNLETGGATQVDGHVTYIECR